VVVRNAHADVTTRVVGVGLYTAARHSESRDTASNVANNAVRADES
jgi:hypothetical protein